MARKVDRWKTSGASPEKVKNLVAVALQIGIIDECDRCGGLGGFEDTTYNRTGEWGHCGICSGRGFVYAGPRSDRGTAAEAAYRAADRRGF